MNENRLEFLKDEMDLKSKEIAKLLNVSESTYLILSGRYFFIT